MIAHQLGDHGRVARVVVVHTSVALAGLIRTDAACCVEGTAAALQHERTERRAQHEARQEQHHARGERQRLLAGQRKTTLHREQQPK